MDNFDNQVGIRIGDLHTWHDFHMYLNAIYIGEAIQELVTIDVPGYGTVNLSDFWGYPVYKSRTLKFEFDVEDSGFSGYYDLSSKLKNALHGEDKRIILDEDNEYYWIGSVSADVQKKNAVISAVTITCTVDPYKYKHRKTVVSQNVTEEQTIICYNQYKRAVPTITAGAAFALEFDGVSAAVPAGTSVVPEIMLKPGRNEIKCQGTGDISFEYQEASL